MDSERKETLDIIQKRIDAKAEAFEEIKTALENSHPELASLMKKILELESKKQAALEEALNEKNSAIASIQTEIDAKKSDYMRIKNTSGADVTLLDAIEEEIGKLESKKHTIETDNTVNAAVASIQTEIAVATSALEKARASLESDPALTELKGEIASLERFKQTRSDQIDRVQEKVDSLDQSRQATLDEFTRSKNEFEASIDGQIKVAKDSLENVRTTTLEEEEKDRLIRFLEKKIEMLEQQKKEEIDRLTVQKNQDLDQIREETVEKKTALEGMKFEPTPVDNGIVARTRRKIVRKIRRIVPKEGFRARCGKVLLKIKNGIVSKIKDSVAPKNPSKGVDKLVIDRESSRELAEALDRAYEAFGIDDKGRSR